MHPFSEGDTSSSFRNIIDSVTNEIGNLDNGYVLKASETELEEHFTEEAFIEYLVLHSGQQYIESQSGTEIDVSRDSRRHFFPGEHAVVRGTKIVIAIPFEGNPMLWRVSPSRSNFGGHPDIEVKNGKVLFSITFLDDSADPHQLKSDISRGIESLEDTVANLNNDVANHNDSVSNKVKEALKRKRELAQAATGAVTALGIPVRRADASPTFTIPAIRRTKPTRLPSVETGAFQPEPVLDEGEYQYILEIMHSMSLVIERNPASFASLDEESIRDHFLIQLNGHYEGGATGETFNASGKTDILIRKDNKNVFIAECKFWRGKKVFIDAVDQLLSYLTWRDSKCALMIFNRTKDSNAVSEKMHESMKSIPEHCKTVSHQSDGDSRYILIKKSEPGKEMIVTTQLYDIPSDKQ